MNYLKTNGASRASLDTVSDEEDIGKGGSIFSNEIQKNFSHSLKIYKTAQENFLLSKRIRRFHVDEEEEVQPKGAERIKEKRSKGLDKVIDIRKDEALMGQLNFIDQKQKTLISINTLYDPSFGFHKPTKLKKTLLNQDSKKLNSDLADTLKSPDK